MTYDQFWSIFAMPIGLMICFGPVALVWLIAELKDSPPKNDRRPPAARRSGRK
ncbi:MAG: hypothetical protein ACYDC1_23095 [Limisphaerales bacterium]